MCSPEPAAHLHPAQQIDSARQLVSGSAHLSRPMMQLALTFDHRALDGAEATRGAVAIKRHLETWDAQAYL